MYVDIARAARAEGLGMCWIGAFNNNEVKKVLGIPKVKNGVAITPRYRVCPVNLNTAEILGDKCYPDPKSLPVKPDVVDTVVPPKVTEEIVEACKELGIKKVWMQLGSNPTRPYVSANPTESKSCMARVS